MLDCFKNKWYLHGGAKIYYRVNASLCKVKINPMQIAEAACWIAVVDRDPTLAANVEKRSISSIVLVCKSSCVKKSLIG